MKYLLLFMVIGLLVMACRNAQKEPEKQDTAALDSVLLPRPEVPFYWEGANVYFLLTDRFNNGNPENDNNFEREEPTGPLRGFMGGDFQGITDKITSGYFDDLGVNAIWLSPVVEQIHGAVDEGTGVTYGYHGYWTKDWTVPDPNFGTRKELENLVKTAHDHGIRILLDVVLNHTGPVTEKDPVWPEEWVRTEPTCDFTTYETTVSCTLVENLPDIRSETDEAVELPDALLAKWKEEGRLSNELDELQRFFDRTGYPRAPRFYIIKWLTDYVHDLGVDGFRVDTAKHVNENTWNELYKEASYAFETWKKKHPGEVLDDNPFYMVGEVYGYGISSGREFDFGDRKVDYFNHGFKSLINFELADDAREKDYDAIFGSYNQQLVGSLSEKSVLNYLSSHDDPTPYDKGRKDSIRAANLLLLAPGASQIYYGDESARSLDIAGTVGDATLRSFMNWEEIDSLPATQKVLTHWQKLGRFRRDHPAVGAGRHKRLAKEPYVFSRTLMQGDYKDKVAIGLDLPKGQKYLWVKGFFGDGTRLRDAYSDVVVEVKNGQVVLTNPYSIALLELAQ